MPFRSRLLFLPFLLLAACAALVAGCGSSGNDKDATRLISDAFHKPIKSADVNFNLQVQVNGVAALQNPVAVKFSGPYVNNGHGKLPSFDFNANISGGGQSVPFGLTSTGDDFFVTVQGQAYEMGKQTVAKLNRQLAQQKGSSSNTSLSELGIHPSTWLNGAKTVGDANVGGTQVTHVTAALDVGKLLDDLNQLVKRAPTSSLGGSTKPAQLSDKQKADIEKAVKNPQIDVYVAKSDHSIRRLAATLEVQVPKGQQSKFNGATGGTVQFSIDFSGVGQQKTIKPPAGAKPISALAGQLNALGGSLGAAGSGSSSGSSGSGSSSSGSGTSTPTAKQFEDYARCVQKAGGNNASALQKCADILK